MTTSKPPKLNMAQVFSLRRIASGTSYSLRGDGKKAHENRPGVAVSHGTWREIVTPYNAPSIPVLYRLGLVNFNNPKAAIAQPTHWHRAVITDAGLIILKLTKDRTE